jgi:hypothetical protein
MIESRIIIELGRIWNELAMACFGVLCRNFTAVAVVAAALWEDGNLSIALLCKYNLLVYNPNPS